MTFHKDVTKQSNENESNNFEKACERFKILIISEK